MKKQISLEVPEDENEMITLSKAAMLPIVHDYSARELIVYMELVAHRHPGERYVEISAAHIGDSIGRCTGSVYEALKRLEEGGFILVDRFPGKSNRYTFRQVDFDAMEEGIMVA